MAAGYVKTDHQNAEPEVDGNLLVKKRKRGFMQEKLPMLDLGDQQHFLNLLPAFLQDAVIRLPDRYLEMTEEELRELCFGRKNAEVPSVHERLRLALWEEYDSAIRFKKNMIDVSRAIHGICTLGYFVNRFIKDPKNVAWLIHPPADYMKGIKEILQMGTSQLREIMMMSNLIGGKPNTKLMEVKLKIYQHIDMRVKGAIIQRIDQRNVSVNVDATAEQAKQIVETVAPSQLSMAEVDAKLKELEGKSLRLAAPARVEVDLMKPPTVMLDADEETKGAERPDLARHRNVSG